MNYIINHDVDGFERIDIADNRLSTCKDCTVIIVLDEESNNGLHSYYNAVRDIIVNGNRLFIVMVDVESRIRKQICMLAASYRNYHIYSVEDKSDIDSEYIETIMNREPTADEVETFIGADITAYSEMNDILLDLSNNATINNIDRVEEIVYGNKEMIECFPSIIDYMKKTIDTYNSGLDTKLAELKSKTTEAENALARAKIDVEGKEKELKAALAEVEGLKNESAAAKQRCIDLEQQVNSSGPNIRTYSTVNTSMIKCRVKSILYFKEISSVRFMNTFITKFMEILQKVDKLKVKLVIYDNRSPFNCIYKPISVIDMQDYLKNKDTIVNKFDKVVVVEPNKVILEDILSAEYDCVLIYDRLRQTEDLVTGNTVYKYWVIDSLYHIGKIESMSRLDRSKIITNIGSCIDALSIMELAGFKQMTNSAKTSQYMQMVNPGHIKGKVIDIIKEKSNIKAIVDANKGR